MVVDSPISNGNQEGAMAKLPAAEDRGLILVAAGSILGGIIAVERHITDEEAAKTAARLAVLLFENVSRELG
jgi:hypothetical protein